MNKFFHLLCLATTIVFWLGIQSGCSSDDDSSLPDGDNEIDTEVSEADRDSEATETDTPALYFEEFAWLNQPRDFMEDFLCPDADDPESAADKIAIDCDIEGESFIETPAEPKNELLVMAYNIERGYEIDRIMQILQEGVDAPTPDVILLVESDRGCSRTGNRHITRELAQHLSMNYVYGVEFVELPREGGPGGTVEATCEHGNAILSRYPLGNVTLLRHKDQRVWYGTEEPRLGGRISLSADVKNGDKLLHVTSIHFESDGTETYRALQGEELRQSLSTLTHPAVLGGDFNSGYYAIDLEFGTVSDQTIAPFLHAGYVDAHATLDVQQRGTKVGYGLILDILLATEDVFSQPDIGEKSVFDDLSDHLPVWATVSLP